jgi:hypothetical protein
MLSDDQNPSDYPYQLLIRARTQTQFEQAIIVITSRIAATALSKSVSEKLIPVTVKTVNSVTLRETVSNRAPAATSMISALQMLADFDDCGTPWPFHRWPHWPWPWPWPWQDGKPSPDPWANAGLFDAAALKTINGLALLVPQVGKELAETCQALLKGLSV